MKMRYLERLKLNFKIDLTVLREILTPISIDWMKIFQSTNL